MKFDDFGKRCFGQCWMVNNLPNGTALRKYFAEVACSRLMCFCKCEFANGSMKLTRTTVKFDI
jgi:hypothetical protein